MKTTKRFGGAWMVAALCALLLAAAPAGAGEAPGTGTIEVAALSPAQEGGQCLAVPAECGAGAEIGWPLLLAQSDYDQCVANCNSDYNNCVAGCGENDASCTSDCANKRTSCR